MEVNQKVRLANYMLSKTDIFHTFLEQCIIDKNETVLQDFFNMQSKNIYSYIRCEILIKHYEFIMNSLDSESQKDIKSAITKIVLFKIPSTDLQEFVDKKADLFYSLDIKFIDLLITQSYNFDRFFQGCCYVNYEMADYLINTKKVCDLEQVPIGSKYYMTLTH